MAAIPKRYNPARIASVEDARIAIEEMANRYNTLLDAFNALPPGVVLPANLVYKDLITGLIDTADLGTGTADNTTFLRGDQTYNVPAGGGGGLLQVWDPDVPPTVPNALDVEFATNPLIAAWPAAWTVCPVGSHGTEFFPATRPGRFTTYHNAGGWRGRYAAVGAGDFTLAARAGWFGDDANYSLIGIGVGTGQDPHTGTYASVYVGYNSGHRVNVETGSAPVDFFNWGWNDSINTGVVIYIRRVGTNLYFGWSHDGIGGAEVGPFVHSSIAYLHLDGYDTHGGVSGRFYKWVRFVQGVGMGAYRNWGALRAM